MSVATKIAPPQLKDESTEGFDRFLSQFDRYLRLSKTAEDERLDLLLLCVGDRVAGFYDEVNWPIISEEEKTSGLTEYKRAIKFLKGKLSGDKNILSERLRLYSHRQLSDQPMNDYLSSIRLIAKYCDFPASFADEAMRDAFCLGLYDQSLKQSVCREFSSFQRLGKPFTLNDAMATAEVEVSAKMTVSSTEQEIKTEIVAPLRRKQPKQCFWCGSETLHGREKCPARSKSCNHCHETGHFENVCRKRQGKVSTVPVVSVVTKLNEQKRKFLESKVNGKNVDWLVDSGSDLTLISKRLCEELNIFSWKPIRVKAEGANGNQLRILGKTHITIELKNHFVQTVAYIADRLCDNAIIGMDTLGQFESLHIDLCGSLPSLKVALTTKWENQINVVSDKPSVLKISPVPLFANVPQVSGIRSPSRYKNKETSLFIKAEIEKLEAEGIIVPSTSSWRSQAFVVKSNGKQRMVVDFASTINRYTDLDAFPVPLIPDVLHQLEGSRVFSRVDLRSAYYQVPILKEHQHFTAFEANNRLYEFTRLPFGVTNGVPIFCRVMQNITAGLKGVSHYFDDIVIHGMDQAEHDRHLQAFLKRAAEVNLSLNSKKSIFSTSCMTFLGHVFENGLILPDPERMKPLQEFPTPSCLKELERLLGLFVYYSKWVKNFAEVSEPLFAAKKAGIFPLTSQAVSAIDQLKKAISESFLAVPQPGKTLTLETDASLVSIGAVLSQEGKPIAFFSHKLNDTEKRWPIVELEAYSIIRATEAFRHFLLGTEFNLITDQKSVAFLLDSRPKNKIKNAKINRWRLSMAEFVFNVQYRAGADNHAADAFSRIASVEKETLDSKSIQFFHDKFGHPGISRMNSFLSNKYNSNDVNKIIKECVSSCDICAKHKPRFPSIPVGRLVVSTFPWQRISIDFVGPKPSSSPNKFLFTVVDEFSRFPFAFAVRGPTTQSAIQCLSSLFTLFGPPHSVHSDRGRSFESVEFVRFLESWNIIKSRTTPYHPQGNGQIERMHSTLWKTIQTRLAENGKQPEDWESEVNFALANMRLLPSRCIDFESPHVKFLSFRRRTTLDTPLKGPETQIKASLPDWLQPGKPAYLKINPGKVNKYRLEKVVIEAVLSPYHARVQFTESGRRDTVSLRHLTRSPGTNTSQPDLPCSLPQKSEILPNVVPLEAEAVILHSSPLDAHQDKEEDDTSDSVNESMHQEVSNTIDEDGVTRDSTDSKAEMNADRADSVRPSSTGSRFSRRISRPPMYLKDFSLR